MRPLPDGRIGQVADLAMAGYLSARALFRRGINR
jgi:hypothetical protein